MIETLKTCLFIFLVTCTSGLSAQCDSNFEYSTELYPQGNVYYAHVHDKETQLERQVSALFFNDTLVKEGQIFPSQEEVNSFFTTSFLLFCMDNKGMELWKRHYNLRLEQIPNMLQSNIGLIVGKDSMTMIVMIDSGTFALDENHEIYSDKNQLVALHFDASDGSYLGFLPILSDGNRYSGLSFGRWQSVVLKNQIRHYFVPYTEITINNQKIIPYSSSEDHVIELITDWYGTYETHRTVLESSYCTVNFASELNGEIYLSGRFTGSIQLKDSTRLFSNDFVQASDVYLLKMNTHSEDMKLVNVTNSIGGELILGIVPYDQGVGLLLDIQSGEIMIGENIIQTGVDDCGFLIFDKDLMFQNFIKISFLKKPDFLIMSAFLSQEKLPALYINSDRKYYLNGNEKSSRNQGNSGRTIAHYYLNLEGNVYKQNVFWTNKFAIIEPLWESDGTVYYRGVQFESIQGALNIPWMEQRQRLFQMQKCTKNIMTVRERTSKVDQSVYPNPFKDNLKILGENSSQEVYVIDALGRCIHEGELNEAEINTSKWLPGVYFLQMKDAKPIKLIKQE